MIRRFSVLWANTRPRLIGMKRRDLVGAVSNCAVSVHYGTYAVRFPPALDIARKLPN